MASIESLGIDSIGEESINSANSNWRRLPRRIQNAVGASDSVVIIQPLISGVEGLGKFCRVFDGVFDVGLDVREAEAETTIGVEGFHPVGTYTIN